MKKILTLAITLSMVTSLNSCSWFKKGKDKEADIPKKPVEEMYADAKMQMEKGYLEKSIKQYQEVERLYPFSPYANKARVMEAYSQYKDGEYDKAIDVIDDFVAMNPGSEEVAFMYYLKAICYYDRIQDVKRDQGITLKAQSSFEEVINRFPESKYARDSQYKLDLIKDHLAAKEMEVGRFYEKQKNYIAALNRFQTVVKDYENTEQIEEALYRLVEVNTILGFDSEAIRYATVLGYNYSSGEWYKRAYELVKDNNLDIQQPTYVGKSSGLFGLGSSEPSPSQPAALQSSPNIVDTEGWINDDSAIQDQPKTPQKTSAEKAEKKALKGGSDDVVPDTNENPETGMGQPD